MSLETIISKIRNYSSLRKTALDRYVDPAFFWTASNLGLLYGASEVVDIASQSINSHENLLMGITYLGLASGAIVTNKYLINPITKTIKRFKDKRLNQRQEATALSWVKSAIQAGTLATLISMSGIGYKLDNLKEQSMDLLRGLNPISYQEASFSNNEFNIIKSDINTTKGKYERTKRWHSIINKVENKYQIPKGLIAGLIMRESMGDPLMLNGTGDGGAGLGQFQPGTARQYGLNIYGTSRKTGRDSNHGRELRELVRSYNYNYNALRRIDERFDVDKSIDAMGRLLKNLYESHKDWNKALSAYNRGTPARNPTSTSHVKMTRKYQNFYNQEQGKRLLQDIESVCDFDFIGRNSRDIRVYKCNNAKTNNPSLIARAFNRWDNENNYGFTKTESVVDRDGKTDSEKPRVYVLAEEKKEGIFYDIIGKIKKYF
jgi:soluble lytic murein transglycosylase-like protein